MPRGFHIASAWVDINAEDRGLRQQVERMIKKAVAGQKIEIPVTIDSKNLRNELTRAMKKASSGQGVAVPVKIDSKGLRRELQDAIHRAAAGNKKVMVPIGISSKDLRREIRDALMRAAAGDKINVPIGVSSRGLRGEIKRALIAAASGERIHVPVKIDVDARQVDRAVTAAARDAKAEIKTDVDARHLRQQLMQAIRNINVHDGVTVNTNIDRDMLRNQIASEIGRLRDKYRVRIGADIDTDTFAARLREAARTVGGRNDIPVDLNPRINTLRLRAETAAAAARLRPQINFHGDLNVAMTRAKLMASLAAAKAGLHINIPVRLDNNNFEMLRRSIGSIEEGFRRIEGPTGRWAKIITGVAAIIGPTFAAADHLIRSTGASLAVTVPLIGMLGTGLTAAIIGFEHMGKTIGGIFGASATDVKQLGDNLESLSPKARDFADELMKLQPGFTQLRLDVQDTLFNNMATTLDDFTHSTMPVLRRGFAGSAIDLNKMADGAIKAVNNMSRMGTLDRMFGGLKTAMDPLVKIPAQFLNAWVKTSIAATPLLTRMDTAFGNWATRMTTKLNTAFENGRLQAAISKAGDVIANYFHRLANNPEMQEFVKRMEENGPRVAKALGDISTAIVKVINSIAPITQIILTVVDAFARFINAMPTIFLDALIAKFIIFKTVLGITGIVKSVTAALVAMRLSIAALSGNTARMVTLLTPGLSRIGVAAPGILRTATALGIFLRASLLIGGILFMFRTLGWAMDKIFGAEHKVNVDKLSTSLREFNNTGKVSGEMAKDFGANWTQQVDGMDKKFGGLQKAVQQIAHANAWDDFFHGFQSATSWITGTTKELDKARDKVSGVDKALAGMVKEGNIQEANAIFNKLAKEVEKGGTSTAKFKSLLTKYNQALKDSKAAQLAASITMGAYGAQAVKTQAFLEENRQAVDGLKQSIEALNDVNRQAMTDEVGFHEAVTNATDTIMSNVKGLKDKSKALDLDTKKGQENKRALIELAQRTSDFAQSTLGATRNYTKANQIYQQGRAELIKLAMAAGQTEGQAKKLADQILRMPDMSIAIDTDVSAVNRKIDDVQAKIDSLKQKRKTAVGADKTKFDAEIRKAQAELDKLKQKRAVILQAASTVWDAQLAAAQRKLDGLKQKRKTAVGADKTKLDAQIAKAQKEIDGLKQKKATALLVADLVSRKVASAQKLIDAMHGKKVTVDVMINGKLTGVDPSKYYSQGPHKGSRYGGPIRRAFGGMVAAFQGGGISGPGGPTADLIHAMLSNGEFVMRAAAVKKYGLGFFNMLNKGMVNKQMLPQAGFAMGGAVRKYASGGSTGGGGAPTGTLANAIVKITANTTDINSKIAKTQALLNKLKGPKAVTIKATDGTKKATDSAKKNMSSVGTVNQQTFNKIKSQTTTFNNQWTAQMNGLKTKNASVWKSIGSGLSSSISGAYSKVKTATTTFSNSLNAQMNSIKTKNAAVWKSVGTSLNSSVTSAYNKVKAATTAFGNSSVAAVSSIKTKTVAQWNSLGSSMQARTKSMFSGIRNATNSFGSQNVAKFKQIVNATGGAWNALGPKFKPPVSYLIHTVINQGVVGGMNAIISKLQGGKKVSGVSVGGFATGGHIQGPGSKTSDSILARLSHGEFVMRAAAVDKYGPQFMQAINEGRMPGFASGGMIPSANISVKLPRFASGGSVPSTDSLNKMIGNGNSAGYQKVADWVLQHIVEPLIGSGPGGSAMKDTMQAGVHYLEKNMATFLEKNVIPSFMGGKIPTGSRLAIINAALKAAGVPPPGTMAQWQAGLNTLITRESGWNSKAINRTDSNAKAGHPSQGLAQTIPGTFNAYVPASLRSRGILDPVANVAAAIRYIVARYGNITRVQQANASLPPKGYARGGSVHGPGTGTSDSLMARLSSGEFVIRSSAVNKYGRGFLNAINAGKLPMPGLSSGGTTYTIRSGDTLSGIASKYHISLSTLLNANPSYKSHPNSIYPGNKLVIPGSSSGSSSGGSSSGGSSSGGSVSKAPSGDIQDASNVTSLQNLVTLRESMSIANKYGAGIQNEAMSSISSQDSLDSLLSNLTSFRSAIYDAFKGKTQDVLAAKFTDTANRLIPLQQNLDKVRASLETAQQALDDVKAKFDQLKDSVASSIVEYGNITKIGKYGTSPQTLIAQMTADAGKATQFSDQLAQLKAKGVNGSLIEQIANAGITGGGMNTAQSLLNATPQQIAQINALQAQIATTADKAGQTAADATYGAGVQAAQGLVNGLKSQEKAIVAEMQVIANALVQAVRQALGIKSPSRVMAEVGHYTAMGFAQGMTDKEAEIKDTVLRLGSIPAKLNPAIPSAGGDGTIKNGGVTIENMTINVNGSFNISNPGERRALAVALAKDVKEAIRQDDRKRA